MQVFIALGSNRTAVKDGTVLSPRQALVSALQDLSFNPKIDVLAASGLYRSSAVGPGRQRPFVNAVAALQTILSPEGLMAVLADVEVKHGRQASAAWHARPLDLDIIDFSGLTQPALLEWRAFSGKLWPCPIAPAAQANMSRRALTLPHARAHSRDFVLKPMKEMCPGWRHPALNQSVEQLLKARSGKRTALRRLGPITL